MFERASNTFILDRDYFEQQADIGTERPSNSRLRYTRKAKDLTNNSIVDGRAMTRKTRTRRPRIQSIQSGYCEICHKPYNSLDDHIQSKRHQKLIGEDAGYIAINGFLNQDANIESFLNINIDPLDNDISLRGRRRNMARNRAASVVCDRVKPSPLSPAHSEIIGHHHLRSRRNINYMTPPLDEDSLPESEKPDFSPSRLSPTPTEYPREGLRSSARVLARLTEKNEEVWNSGRPKRSCIRQRRNSTEERIIAAENTKAFYKVEMLTPRQRALQLKELIAAQKNLSEEEKDKGLIVKFKKMSRNSELMQLNTEATNFLFPSKKCNDSSEDDEDPDENGANTTASTGGHRNSSGFLSSDDESRHKFKVEDDGSMDSVGSDNRKRKKRRTHAEAFIMDNHKYYKFEMPGSRLRYHGSFLSNNEGIKSPKTNGDCVAKQEKDEKSPVSVKLDNYQFSFERVPKNEQWYDTFRRQDRGDMRYPYFSDFFWDSFMMPYQMGPLPPLDPKKCIQQYAQIKSYLMDPPSAGTSAGSTTPDPSASNSSTSFKFPDVHDEDSTATASSASSFDYKMEERNKRRRKGRFDMSPTITKNPRKSPRQHASTLAILSSLIQQRKRKSRSLDDSAKATLPVIPEEPPRKQKPSPRSQVAKFPTDDNPRRKIIVCSRKPRIFQRKKAPPKVDYNLIATKIEDEITSTLELEDNFEDIEPPTDSIDFKNSQVQVSDILNLAEDTMKKDDDKTIRRFFNGSPGRKPGKRKKKNLTGWPNKIHRRLYKKEPANEKVDSEDNSTNGSVSDEGEANANSTDSINKKDNASDQTVNSVEENCDPQSDRVEQPSEKILTVKITNSELQPYVCVPKLKNEKVNNKVITPPTKRTSRRQRRMPGSPKSPRILRKPRGRWYRER